LLGLCFLSAVDNNGNDEVEKTLAILIGLIAAVALLIVFLSFFRKVCERERGKLLIGHLSLHLYSSLYFILQTLSNLFIFFCFFLGLVVVNTLTYIRVIFPYAGCK
jgi:CDP-diglyceride synthetase